MRNTYKFFFVLNVSYNSNKTHVAPGRHASNYFSETVTARRIDKNFVHIGISRWIDGLIIYRKK